MSVGMGLIEKITKTLKSVFAKGDIGSNTAISQKQKSLIKIGLGLFIALILALMTFIQEKQKAKDEKALEKKEEIVKLELPDTTIDTEKRWRDHFETVIEKHHEETKARLAEMEEQQAKLLAKANSAIEQELRETKEKLEMAKAELATAGLEMRMVTEQETERAQNRVVIAESSLNVQEFEQEIEYDRPKSAANYIPEGTYFNGYLLGGIVVSTALNTPDENATPVTIKLTSRGNLDADNKMDISKCRIMGSSYGDLSSERAIIRLEKLVCLRDGMYQTSKIAGQIYGPDGYNGIKGAVVSTSSKHLKNAMIGGMISGLSGNAKGQDGLMLSGAGAVSTKKKGMGDMLTQGGLQGVSNAGDKLAEYYLKQAESMSPVLTVPSGVRVQAQITKGFFVGEVSTHQKIKQAKQ